MTVQLPQMSATLFTDRYDLHTIPPPEPRFLRSHGSAVRGSISVYPKPRTVASILIPLAFTNRTCQGAIRNLRNRQNHQQPFRSETLETSSHLRLPPQQSITFLVENRVCIVAEFVPNVSLQIKSLHKTCRPTTSPRFGKIGTL
jgi:hypothetical protein